MRILYSHYLLEDEHPAAQMVRSIAAELTRRGHEVRIHRSAGPSPPAGSPPATLRRPRLVRLLQQRLWFARRLARNLGMLRRDQQVLRDWRPDVLLVRQDAYCLSMVQAARSTGLPVVTYADAPVAYESRLFPLGGNWHPPGVVEAVERWVLRNSQAVLTISNPAARCLHRYGLSVPVHVVPNGVPAEWFASPSIEERRDLRQQLGITSKHVVGFVGSFRSFHGLDHLAAVMRGLAHRDDVEWLLVGDGPGRATLEQAAAGRVRARFLGRQPAHLLPKLVALMDVAVAPQARVEGEFYFCPLKLLEYAAAGRAVVAGTQGDIPHLLPENCAVTVDEGDLAGWVQAVENLLEDADFRTALGRNARVRVLDEFTWARTAERVESVLAQVVAAGRPDESSTVLGKTPTARGKVPEDEFERSRT